MHKLIASSPCIAFLAQVEELVELTYLRGGLVGLPGRDGLSVEQRSAGFATSGVLMLPTPGCKPPSLPHCHRTEISNLRSGLRPRAVPFLG